MVTSNLSKFKEKTTILLFVCAAVELVFFFNTATILATSVLLYGWTIIKVFVLTHRNLKTYPVSFLMILGLAIFHFILPMPLTLLELKPVTYNMDVPFLTFGHHFLFVTVIVLTHIVYTNISNGKNIFRNLLLRTEFYTLPTNKIIWITALFGLFSTYFLFFVFHVWQTEAGNRSPFFHIAAMFIQFNWMPLILFFPKIVNKTTSKQDSKPIIIYSLILLLFSIASNLRTLLFSGLLLFVIMYGIGFLYGYYNFRKLLTPRRAIISLIVFYIFSGPLIDLGYAMVYVRQDRTNMSTSLFLDKTISIYNNKTILKKVKTIDISTSGPTNRFVIKWDEHYLDNAIMNRFCNLKISDGCLFHATNIGYQNSNMQAEFINQLSAMLPNVLLEAFDIKKSNKKATAAYSITDYLYSQSSHDSSIKGSSIIGSMPGLGMAIFGYWYLLVVFCIFLIVFTMFDSFVKVQKDIPYFPYYFFIMLLVSVNFFNDRHVFTYEFRFIFRTYFESAIVFIIIMKLINRFSYLIKIA